MKAMDLEFLLDRVMDHFPGEEEVYVELETADGKMLFSIDTIDFRKTVNTKYIVLTCNQKEFIKLTK